MHERHFKELKPGYPLSSSDYNRLVHAVDGMGGRGGPGQTVSDGAGHQQRSEAPEGFWARLDSCHDADGYAFTEMRLETDGTMVEREDGLQSVVTADVPFPAAFEATGNLDVPADESVIVWMQASLLGAFVFLYLQDDGIWVRIDSGTNPYAWTEMEPLTGGTWGVLAGGRTGSTTVTPAYEQNDNSSVPSLSIVRLRPVFRNGPTVLQEYTFVFNDVGFWAKVTAGTNPYTWTEQTPAASGTWGNKSGGRTGTLDAYEENDNTGVPADIIVWMRLAASGEYTFKHQRGTITVQAEDDSPTVPNVHTLEFEEDDGFAVSGSSGTALVNLAVMHIGVLDGALSAGGTATMSIWDGGSDTTENITVNDWLLPTGGEVASGANVIVGLVAGEWYVIAAECAE